MFVGAHVLLADRTGVEELAISMDEGTAFVCAAQKVMRHYAVETTQKTMDWLSFMGTTSMIYIPRFIAYKNRKSLTTGTEPPGMGHNGGPPLSVSTPGPQDNVIRPAFDNGGHA